jgi:delta11-fatty-acid desaturase
MAFVKPVQMIMSGEYNRSVTMMPISRRRLIIHIIGRILAYCACFVWPFFVFPLLKAIAFATVPIALVSCSFMLSSQVNHLSEVNVDVADPDYYRHQVLTSHTMATDSPLTYLFMGGLNFQIEHHLFPCINHCHLKHIQPIVKDACRRHNIPYHYSPTLWVAFKKYISHLVSLAHKDE